MTDKEKVVTHLQIIHTWAFFDERYGWHRCSENCLDVGQWTADALYLLKEQDEKIEKLGKESTPIVRCRDCKHYDPDKYEPGTGDCAGPCDNLVKVSDDWFCAGGKRKDERITPRDIPLKW